ncbi:hypothetical protein Ocin01_13415 [Orchesella cincta]|uniref:UEV domain-containing protein n=1 Tax=Orchesella cincta TaxID=48709 RepID=A0A1D2MK57_ORCCI|nr:hypothetical protein Ocin01_13415 [Orchesella cincta]
MKLVINLHYWKPLIADFLMEGLQSAVLWVSNQYKDINKTKKDILEAIRMYKGLKPISDRFVFNNGTQKTLLSLTGTIPIRYKGSSYNIPVVIWLLDTHPINAPMVFVKPTPDMRIKRGSQWESVPSVFARVDGCNSDLLGLIQVLICTFSEQPPVYAVPPGTPQPQQQPAMPSPYGTPYPVSTPYPAMPSMPMPPGGSPVPQPVTTSGGSLGTLAPSLVRSSLLSAVEEKIRRRMDDQYLGAEIMRGTGKQLQEGRDKLERMVKDLNEEKANLERSMELCRKESRELEEEINRAKEIENEPDIDSAIVPPTPLYRQIVQLC